MTGFWASVPVNATFFHARHENVWFLQVGRSTESPIDFVVTDTVSGGQNDDAQITQSTISRFACRIVCDRNEPYTARIFAAGFDSSKNIFLGVSTVTVLWFLLTQSLWNNGRGLAIIIVTCSVHTF